MWKEARTFSECEAWIDLIQSARFEATVTIERIGGREVSYGRGQYPASIRFLAKKWDWGEQKVRDYLEKLKIKKMITTNASQGMNIITLCNYDKYNDSNSNDTVKNTANNTENNIVNNIDILLMYNKLQELITQSETQKITQTETQQEHSENTKNKKEKKEEEFKEIFKPPTPFEGDECDENSFEKVWEMYERKGNKKTSMKKWKNLNNHCREEALAHIPLYVKATPDKQYRKNFETYISQEAWNDEIINKNSLQREFDKDKFLEKLKNGKKGN